MATLIDRAQEAGIAAIVLSPGLSDFNEDPCTRVRSGKQRRAQ